MTMRAEECRDIFGLLRHGETVWNREKRVQGSGDSPLTPEGIVASRAWGRFLQQYHISWNRIVVSPLLRARQTAVLVNESLQLPVVSDENIRELGWGQWEGLTLEQIKQEDPGLLERLTRKGWDFRPPGGESRRELLKRVLASLDSLKERWPGENLLLISHLGVIKALLYHIEERMYQPSEPKILHKNHFHAICYDKGTLSILNKNITLPGRE